MAHSPWLTLIVPGIGASLARAAQTRVQTGPEREDFEGREASQERSRQGTSRHGKSREGRFGLDGVWRRSGERWPLLARLAGRGALAMRWDRRDPQADLRPWQRGLLSALELSPEPFASAPVSVAGWMGAAADGVGGERGGTWLHAEPVHFAAGLNRLTFLGLEGAARVTGAERDALRPLLADHLQASGLVLAPSRDWLIHSPRLLSVHTSCPDAAAANELERVMPRGADSGMLRRLMTELQMLLHEHPVNQARARLGLPAINSVWLWGVGSAAVPPAPAWGFAADLPVALGQAAFLRGLYQLQSQYAQSSRDEAREIQPLPGEGSALVAALAAAPRAIAVIESGSLASDGSGFNNDAGAGNAPAMAATDELAEVDALEQRWLAPLTRALAAGELGRLDLVLDDWHCDVTRGALKWFWRKSLPVARWPAMGTATELAQ